MKKTFIIIGVAVLLMVCILTTVFVLPQVIVKDTIIKTMPTKLEYRMTAEVSSSGQIIWKLEGWDMTGFELVKINAAGGEIKVEPKDYKIFYPLVNDVGNYDISIIMQAGKKELKIPITVVK